MPVEPIKLRCAQCQQLLGVSPSKAGTTVSCPRCGAGVRVPEPGRAEPEIGAVSRPVGSSPDDDDDDTPSDDAISLEILEIRPEDIRAEGASRTREPAIALPDPRRPPGPEPESSQAAPRAPRARKPQPMIPIDEEVDDDEEDEEEEEPIVPPIRMEENRRPGGAAPRTPPARASDLVVPRFVASAWSLLALLAVTFAFVAGLLAGHYVWKVH